MSGYVGVRFGEVWQGRQGALGFVAAWLGKAGKARRVRER